MNSDQQPAFGPGYPKIPNQEHQRQEIDHDAVLAFMPTGEPMVEPSLTAFKVFKNLKDGDEQFQWTTAFTVPALFARVRNLEAQVLRGWEQAEHWQRECNALVEQANVRFVSDRRDNTDYRMRIVKAGSMEDRNCFGLPTVLHVQVIVPRTGHFLDAGEHAYEGKYVLLENHRGDRAMTSTAQAEAAIVRLTEFLPGPFTEREDPAFIASQAIDALKNRQLLLRERAETEKALKALEPLIAKAQKALADLSKGKAPKTNLFAAQAAVNTILDRVIALRGEDPAPSEDDLD